MEITLYGRRAVASSGFKQDLRKILREEGAESATTFTAIVLCADAKGRVRVGDDAAFLLDLDTFCQGHADLITTIINSAVEVN
jgi:hypothetical protein